MKLLRYFQNNHVTLGVLIIDNKHSPIYTLEPPWRDNERDISCIPQGKYRLAPYNSAKYPDVWEVKDVPGRTAILFHIGNYLKDTRGCILPGMGVMPECPMVNNSVNAIGLMRVILGRQEDYEIEIINL